MTVGWKKVPNIVRMIKLRWIRWTGHVAQMRGKRNNIL
jgi:hypothetical protein